MAHSLDSRDEREVYVRIQNENEFGKQSKNASKFDTVSSSCCKLPGSSKVSKVSFEDVVAEALRQHNKDLPEIGNRRAISSSGEEERSTKNSNYYSRKNSWVFLVEKTKSKFIDPKENYQGLFQKDNEQEEEDDTDKGSPEEHKSTKHSAFIILQLVSLVLIIAALVCSLLVPFLKRLTLWDLPLWKWEMLVLSIISGHLVSSWAIRIAVNFTERNSLLPKGFLYFVYGLQNSVQNCLWLGLVLLVWHCMFNDSVQEQTKSEVLPYVGRIIVCLLVVIPIWPFKNLIVRVLALSFHINTFFDRIREAVFNQYVVEKLSGPPLSDRRNNNTQAEKRPSNDAAAGDDLRATLLQKSSEIGTKSQFSRTMSSKQQTEITVDDLKNLNRMNITAWNMKRLLKIVRLGILLLDEQILNNSDEEDKSFLGIGSESQAEEAAKKIFNKVAKPESL